MKMFFLLTAMLSGLLYAAPKEVDRAFEKERNLLENPGFENGQAEWTKSGASTFQTSNVSLAGKLSGVWNPAALGDTFVSPVKIIQGGHVGNRCQVYFDYAWVGVAGEIIVKVKDGSNVSILENELVPTLVNQSTPFFNTFPCGDSVGDGLQVVLESTATSSGITLDNFFLGSGRNSLYRASKNTIVVKSSGVASSTDGVQLTFTDLEIGAQYEIELEGSVNVIDGAIVRVLAVHNGLTITQGGFDSATGAAFSPFHAAGLFTATATTLTIENNNFAGSANRSLLSVKARLEKRNDLDSNVSESVTYETQGNFWQGSIADTSGDTLYSLGLTTSVGQNLVGDWTITNIEGEALMPCGNGNEANGVTCTTASEVLGIGFLPIKTGKHEVCMEFRSRVVAGAAQGMVNTFYFAEVDPVSGATLANKQPVSSMEHYDSASGTTSTEQPHKLCIYDNATAGVKKVYRLQMNKSIVNASPASNNLTSRAVTGTDLTMATYTIRNMDQAFPTPVFPDYISDLANKLEVSNTTGEAKLCAVQVETFGGSGAVLNDIGGCTASTLRNAAGDYNVGFVAGTYSSSPICTCSSVENLSTICNVTEALSTGIRIRTSLQGTGFGGWEDATTAAEGFMVTCIGTK